MDRIKKLSIDTETFSDVDLAQSGVYRYCESPDFDILLFGYSVNDGPVQVVDLASGEELPDEIINALTDNSVTKWAHNAAFERICLSRWLKKHYPERFRSYGAPDDHVGNYLDPAGWRCTMVWSAYMGLPLSLKDVGAVLKLEDQKLAEGKDLVRYFCIPCRPTAANGGRTRNMPTDAPEDWELFKKYNARDVEVEQSITHRLSKHPVPEFVWDEYHQSEEINDRGIGIDRQLVESAIEMDTRSRQELMDAMREITALENPNSAAQLKDWLCKCGLEIDTLGKKEVAAIIKEAPPELQKVLSLRLQLSKSSVKKYQAMHNCVCVDGRARGMFFFYGANRTGRFSGKLVQLQNLYRNDLPDLDYARALVRAGDYDAVQMLYEDVPDTLSQLIRTAFIAPEGNLFYVADFSAIEARVIAWLAGEQWRMDLFRNGGDIYCQSASQMFKVPVEKHGINGHLRQKGKIAELACIAENSPVLTDHGIVPIQNVTKAMRVWDGENWVDHDGVAYRGEKEVITYDGLTATPDHLVWVEGRRRPITFLRAYIYGHRLVRADDTVSSLAPPEHQDRVRVYDILNAGPHHRFTVSGKLVHNCGYGGSVGALKAMGALEMGLKEEELQPLVKAWRDSNPHIVQLWWDVDEAAMKAVRERTVSRAHGLTFYCKAGMLFIGLPSGRQLPYVKPAIGVNQFGSPALTYYGTGGAKRWERLETYGPKLVENCIGGGTPVLTGRGFIPIEQILPGDVVWDGVDWVRHDGVIAKGVQPTVSVNGIHMTPGHKILTTKGWIECGKAGKGSYWAEVRLPDSDGMCGEHKILQSTAASQMCSVGTDGDRCNNDLLPFGSRMAGFLCLKPDVRNRCTTSSIVVRGIDSPSGTEAVSA